MDDLAAGVVLPRSVKSATPAQAAVLRSLSELELRRREAEAHVDELVLRGRRSGLSWSSLGWALGISGQAVSQRYGKRAGS